MQFLTTYNHGLGLLAVSTFCILDEEIPDSIESYNSIFSEITSKNVQDIIFYGNILVNETSLQWIIPRLIFNSKSPSHVSIMTYSVSEHLLPQRYILVLEGSVQAKELFSLLERLREPDIILVDSSDKDYLSFVRNSCLQKEVKISKIMYNPFKLSPISVLKDEMYDVLPCYCSILDK